MASGLYWNYFYHTWKTISNSPFANAIVFVTSGATISLPETLTAEIISKDVSEEATVFAISLENDGATLEPNTSNLVQTESLTNIGVGVQKYGALIIPATASSQALTLVAEIGGATYTGATTITSASEVGTTVTLNKGV